MGEKLWTEEVLRNVFLLLKEGYDYGEIGGMYGVTRCAVRGAVNRTWVGKAYREWAGVAKAKAVRFWTKSRQEKLKAMYLKRTAPAKIMAELGITHHSLKRALTDFGISNRSFGAQTNGDQRRGYRHSEESLQVMREKAQARFRRPDYVERHRKAHGPDEMRARQADSTDARRGFSVPPALADEYRHLVYSKKLLAREAAAVLGISVARE